MSEVVRHEPLDDCDGRPTVMSAKGIRMVARCDECGVHLCWCEYGYGHDCEVTA